MDKDSMYWEIYDDQESKSFDFVGYTNLAGEDILAPVEGNLSAQVSEIRRLNGADIEIKVYKKQ